MARKRQLRFGDAEQIELLRCDVIGSQLSEIGKDAEVECPNCEGSGTTGRIEMECQACDGTGSGIFDTEQINDLPEDVAVAVLAAVNPPSGETGDL